MVTYTTMEVYERGVSRGIRIVAEWSNSRVFWHGQKTFRELIIQKFKDNKHVLII